MIASVCFLYMQLCDFQAVLCTEDEKKIRHLDTLYEVTMLFTRKVLPIMTDTVWRPQKNIDNNCIYMYLVDVCWCIGCSLTPQISENRPVASLVLQNNFSQVVESMDLSNFKLQAINWFIITKSMTIHVLWITPDTSLLRSFVKWVAVIEHSKLKVKNLQQIKLLEYFLSKGWQIML